jgi:hypothetical protein
LKANLKNLDKRTQYELYKRPGLLKDLPSISTESLKQDPDFDLLNVEPPYNELQPSQVQDLYFKRPELEKYKQGAYVEVPRLFMFCSHQRQYPCLKVLRDKNDKPVYLPDGKTLWSQPSLGLSKTGKPFSERSGYTPSGVYEINGVMPAADNQIVFGKFRRLILQFVPKSTEEINLTYLLSPSHWDQKWWHEGTLARDIGRDLLRMHGTGLKNLSPTSTYAPFVPTSGCVAQREANFLGVKYIDQRSLLDQLMKASNLEPTTANEVKIKGLLYVVEVTNKKGAVDLRLLNELGIR